MDSSRFGESDNLMGTPAKHAQSTDINDDVTPMKFKDNPDVDQLLADIDNMTGPDVRFDQAKKTSGKVEHEVYDSTYYIPNNKSRLLEIPMNSDIFFQMLLYYHQYFDIIFGLMLIPGGIYKWSLGDSKTII